MKNEPEAKFDPSIILCLAYGIIGTVLLVGTYAMLRLLAWGLHYILPLEGWRDIYIALAVVTLTGWLWVIANIICMMAVAIIPNENLPKWHGYAERFSLLWLRRFIGWLIDTRRQGRDMSG